MVRAQRDARCNRGAQSARRTGTLARAGAGTREPDRRVTPGGGHDDARSRTEAALEIAREVGDRTFEGQALGHLGIVEYDLGRLAEARAHWQAALIIAGEVGNRRHEGIMLINLGVIDTDERR